MYLIFSIEVNEVCHDLYHLWRGWVHGRSSTPVVGIVQSELFAVAAAARLECAAPKGRL